MVIQYVLNYIHSYVHRLLVCVNIAVLIGIRFNVVHLPLADNQTNFEISVEVMYLLF